MVVGIGFIVIINENLKNVQCAFKIMRGKNYVTSRTRIATILENNLGIVI